MKVDVCMSCCGAGQKSYEVRSFVYACHEAVTSRLLQSRGRSDQFDLYVGSDLEADKAANANFLGVKVRADTNSNHLTLVATLSPAIPKRCAAQVTLNDHPHV